MAKKRKRDPRVDSNSPDAKLLCSQKGEASCRPSDWMPVAQQLLDVLGSIRDELRGIAQAKSTVDVLADKFLKLDDKVENILNKSKEELKEEIKEVVKLEMQGNFGKSDGVQLDNNQNQSKVICEDYAKAPDSSDASPSLRSQPHLSQPQRFRLQINSTMSSVSYKGRPVQTDDGRDAIEVEMRDGDNPIAPDHPLASVKVNLVLVDSDLFHGISKKLWSTDEFSETLWNRENAKLLKNGTFRLNGGRAIQPKVTITQGTVRKEVRLGVMLEDLGSERVLEGLSNPFKVQEAKTANQKHKESATNGTWKMCNPLGQSPGSNDQHYLARQILPQQMQHDSREREGSAAHHTTQGLPRHIGESLQQTICKMEDPHQKRLPHFYDARSSHPQAMIQGSSHLASSPTEGNGHGRISGQQCNQQTMMTQRCAVPNRSQIMQCVAGNDPISQPQQQYTNPLATTQHHHHGQGQFNSSQSHSLPRNNFLGMPTQTMDLDINMPYSSTSQTNDPQRDSEHFRHTQTGGNGQGQVVSSRQQILPPSSLLAINSQSVGHGDNFQQGQRKIFPQDTSTEAVKHGQEDNFQQGQRQILLQHTSTEGIKHGQGQLNSSHYHNHPQTLPFAKAAQTMDLLNSSQNMPRPSTSQINAPHRDSPWSLPLTQIGEHGPIQILSQPTTTQAMKHGLAQLNSHQDHSLQQKSLCQATRAQPMGNGQVSPHPILPPSSLVAINAQSVGQEDNFHQGQTQILPQHTSSEAVKHAGQGQLNYSEDQNLQQNIISTMRPQTMDLDISLNSSRYMPYSSTSQINATQRDPGTSPHTQSGGNGQAENIDQQFQHAQPKILPETGKDEVISAAQGQVASTLRHILAPSSLPTTNAQSLEQEENFQQGERQILPQHTITEAAKHGGPGQLNSQNLLPTVPRQTMATRLNSSQNRPHYLDALASEVNPPQNSSHFPINNSSGPTVENSGSSQTSWKDSLTNTPEWSIENLERFAGEWMT